MSRDDLFRRSAGIALLGHGREQQENNNRRHKPSFHVVHVIYSFSGIVLIFSWPMPEGPLPMTQVLGVAYSFTQYCLLASSRAKMRRNRTEGGRSLTCFGRCFVWTCIEPPPRVSEVSLLQGKCQIRMSLLQSVFRAWLDTPPRKEIQLFTEPLVL